MKRLDSPLLDHPFFAGMSKRFLREIEPFATAIHFPEGEFVFREGDRANCFFLIVDGKIALQSEARGRGTIVIETIESGQALGWSWLFEPFTWHFDARTVRPTDALMLDATRLRALCEKHPRLGYEVTKRIAELVIHRLHETQLRLGDVYSARSLETWQVHREHEHV
jgi:CRP-like cAMP-binding protein